MPQSGIIPDTLNQHPGIPGRVLVGSAALDLHKAEQCGFVIHQELHAGFVGSAFFQGPARVLVDYCVAMAGTPSSSVTQFCLLSHQA